MNSATRTVLRAKARLGRWDPRYLDWYPGVPDILTGQKTALDARLRRMVMRAFARGLVVTATTNGVHSPTSYHSLGRAIDFGVIETEIGTAKGQKRLMDFQHAQYNAWSAQRRRGLRELLGPDNYTSVLRGVHTPLAEGSALENMHDNHVHIAY